MVAMVSELRSKELQRNQMQLQVEHDKQMTLGFRRTFGLAKRVKKRYNMVEHGITCITKWGSSNNLQLAAGFGTC